MKGWFAKLIVVLSILLIGVYSLIWIFTPTATRFYSSELLKLTLNQNHLVLSDASSIRYNPFLSHLTISDLTLTKETPSGEAVLSIEELSLKVSLYKLIIDEFKITEFEIDGLFLNIDIDGDQIEVAGIPLSNEASTSQEIQNSQELQDEASALIVKMAQFHLYDAKININLDGVKHNVEVSSLGIERVHASQKDQRVGVIADATVDGAPLTMSLTAQLFDGEGTITSYVTLSELELSHFDAFLPETISSLDGQVSFKSEQTVTIANESTTVNMRQVEFKVEQLDLNQEDIHVKFDKHIVTSDDIQVSLSKNNAPVIIAKTAMQMDDFSMNYLNEEQVLAQFKKLAIADMVFNAENHQHTLNVDNIDIFNALFSDNTSDSTLPLMQFNQFAINKLNASDHGLAIEKATLAGFSVDAQLDENKALKNLIALPQTEQNQAELPPIVNDEPTQTPAPTPDEVAEYAINIGEFSFSDHGHINFTDHSVLPIYERHLAITKFVVGPIDNQELETKTEFEIAGESEDYINFDFSGYSQPFSSVPVHHIEGAFKEISLPAVSTYMKEALQYVFDSGQLDLTINTTVTGEEIDGNVAILMRGLELTAAEDDEINTLNDHSAIPFSVALGMLKDRDGNVELDIPLSGSTNDPSFGFSGFVTLLIKRATMSAAQDYLLTTFVPYANVVSVAMTAGDFLLKIRFNDLEFPATQTALQPSHKGFISEFTALLEDKPDEHITLCAIGTAADINKPAGSALNKEDIAKLKIISMARMKAFKTHMVNVQNLASSRLLMCTPQVDTDLAAKPRISFTN